MQRRSVGKSSQLQAAIATAMLANVLLQTRNVLNKKLMTSAAGVQAHGVLQPPPDPLKPFELLLVSLAAALPVQLALQGIVSSTEIVLQPTPSPSRYAHYGDTHVLWLVICPLAFLTYQLASICVLAHVEPVMHAVLGGLKRVVVIGGGAVWTHEAVSTGYVAGAVGAVVGAFAYSCQSVARTATSHTWLRLVLSSVLLLLAFETASELSENRVAPARKSTAVTERNSTLPPATVAQMTVAQPHQLCTIALVHRKSTSSCTFTHRHGCHEEMTLWGRSRCRGTSHCNRQVLVECGLPSDTSTYNCSCKGLRRRTGPYHAHPWVASRALSDKGRKADTTGEQWPHHGLHRNVSDNGVGRRRNKQVAGMRARPGPGG